MYPPCMALKMHLMFQLHLTKLTLARLVLTKLRQVSSLEMLRKIPRSVEFVDAFLSRQLVVT